MAHVKSPARVLLMKKVCVLGAGGKMGKEVCRAVGEADDLDLVALVDPATTESSLLASPGTSGTRAIVTGDLNDVDPASVDVAVDFTDARAAREHLRWCAENGVHIVVGTSGLTDEDVAWASELFSTGSSNAMLVSNFAIGAVLLMRLCEIAGTVMDGVEIVELHHDAKLDAPSGTAIHTATRIASAREQAVLDAFASDPAQVNVLDCARGGVGPGGIRIHAVRLPGLVAHEEVVFGALGQSLTIRHDSYDRRSFMPGVLLAVRCVADRPGIPVGLNSLLGI